MTTPQESNRPHYWQRQTDGEGAWNKDGPVSGADLAALRRGIGREPGTVPAMWSYYTRLTQNGDLTGALRAEHLALTLFAVHQQSQAQPVHRTGIGVGNSLLALRHSGKFSAEAVDRRVSAAATATSIGEVAYHLRGLITQLRSLNPTPALDYTQLFQDLNSWQYPEQRARVRRRWGIQYFAWRPTTESTDSTPTPGKEQ